MDTIVTSVIKKFEKRAGEGLEKYGRTDLKTIDWIEHAQDGILYLEKLKSTMFVVDLKNKTTEY